MSKVISSPDNKENKSDMVFRIIICSIVLTSVITGLVFILIGVSSLDINNPSFTDFSSSLNKFLIGALIMLPGIFILSAIGSNNHEAK